MDLQRRLAGFLSLSCTASLFLASPALAQAQQAPDEPSGTELEQAIEQAQSDLTAAQGQVREQLERFPETLPPEVLGQVPELAGDELGIDLVPEDAEAPPAATERPQRTGEPEERLTRDERRKRAIRQHMDHQLSGASWTDELQHSADPAIRWIIPAVAAIGGLMLLLRLFGYARSITASPSRSALLFLLPPIGLVAGLLPGTYEFDLILNSFVALSAGVIAIHTFQRGRLLWALAFATVVVGFNPLAPVRLGSGGRTLAELTAAVLFVYAWVKLVRRRRPLTSPIGTAVPQGAGAAPVTLQGLEGPTGAPWHGSPRR